MTRESKLAVILGFAVVLVVAALISDHFSHARQAKIGTDLTAGTPRDFGASPSGLSTPIGPTTLVSSQSPFVETEGNANKAAGVKEPGSDADRRGDKAGGHDEIEMGGPQGKPKGTTPGRGSDESTTPSGTRAPETAIALSNLPYSAGKAKDYKIQESDSLYKIAKVSYGDPSLWEELADYNKGRIGAKNALRAGATLVIPPKDVLLGKAQLPPAGTSLPDKPRAARVDNETGGTQPDERRPSGSKTEGGYAYDKPSDVRRLAQNDAPSKTERLVAPGPGRTPSESPAKPADKKKPAAEAETAGAKATSYTVRRGDQLSTIARTQLGSARRVSEILRLNPSLDDEDSIVEGMVLKLPAK